MTEVLSESEVDYLLDSLDNIGDIEDEQALASDGGKFLEKEIKLYDFKYPDRFSKEQLRIIEVMHETFARLVANNLSTQLRTFVDVHVQSVTQVTYEEFMKTIPNPTLFTILDMQPLNGSAILEINPSITFSIVERLFGGQGGSILNRELTEIEQSVSANIVESMLGFLREAWRRIVQIRMHLIQIETNTHLAQVVPPNEMMLMITFNCRINDVDGMINIAFPYITIESILPKLSSHVWYSAGYTETASDTKATIENTLQDIHVDLKAVLGSLKMTMGEILSLQKDDVLQFHDIKYDEPITVYVEQQEKFKAIPGRLGNKKAIRIIDSLAVDIEKIAEAKQLKKKNIGEEV